MGLRRDLGENYSPTLFLAALGNGGLAAGMYVYIHFMIKHTTMTVAGHAEPVKVPMATFEAVRNVLVGDVMMTKVLVVLSLIGIVVFAVRHYFYLVWNIIEFNRFKRTDAYRELLVSDKEISLAAIPLTFTLSINVFFVLGGVFVPGLWSIVEYMFPAALVGFLITGLFAMKIFVVYMSRLLSTGGFDATRNNSLSQMVAVFAFAMVAVGFAAPSGMSTNLITSALGIIGSTLFLSATILIGLQTLIMGYRAMMEHGVDRENSPTLWIMVPILTLIGITVVRVDHGLHMNLGVHTQPGELFANIFFLLSLQVVFGIMGWHVMEQVNYFKEFIYGERRSHMSYALICPGVAFHVFGMFALHMGLVRMEIVPMFGVAYWIIVAALAFVQAKTILLLFRLDRKLLMD